jgi:hypothetical protein
MVTLPLRPTGSGYDCKVVATSVDFCYPCSMDRSGSSKGGKQTLANHGKEHFREIGARGFATTVARHYGGDAAEYLHVQRKRAAEHGVAGFVDRLMKERLDQGEETVCVELPVILEPDDEPW